MGEAEERSFDCFAGKGGHSGLVPSELCLLTKGFSEEYFRSGSRAHDQLLDILLFG